MSEIAGTLSGRVAGVERGYRVWNFSSAEERCRQRMRKKQAGLRGRATAVVEWEKRAIMWKRARVSGSDCSAVREKRYLVAAKQRLGRLRKMKTPPRSPLSAQLRGERTKEPLAVGSS